MKRTLLLSTLSSLCFALGCGDEPAAPTKTAPATGDIPIATGSDEPRLNVVLITIDTLRADALRSYGQERFTSPNLDRLAREGTLFLQASTSAPTTLPSHASIMTAKHPFTHGARANAGFVLHHDNETLAEALQRAGYRTGAEIAASVIGHQTQLDQGFDLYRDTSYPEITRKSISTQRPDGSTGSVELDEREAGDITEFGIEFLRAEESQPFFLWLHYFDPHMHYVPPPAFSNLIPDSPYHAEVRYVDSEIGRLVRHLESLDLRERTVVVVTSDHGEALGEHDESTHAFFLFETTVRVPLIFWGPESIPSGRRVLDHVRTIDLAPTILDILGLPPLQNVQGRSLIPLVEGQGSELDLLGYAESMELNSMFGTSILRSVRRGDWKLIHKLRPELYDLGRDPSELADLSQQHPAKFRELTKALHDEVRKAPSRSATGRVAIDDDTIRQLQALGYAGAEPVAELDDEVAMLEPRGPDPADLLDDVRRYGEAWGHYSVQQYEEAAATFEALAKRHPRSVQILTSLARVLIDMGRPEDAVSVLHKARDENPRYVAIHLRLAKAEELLGNLEASEAAARVVLDLQPCNSQARLAIAQTLRKQDQPHEQVEVLARGVRDCPDDYEVMNNYAYLLATSPNDEIRDGHEAVRIAKLAVEGSGGGQPAILDTLAGAYAATGDFENAVSISRRAVNIAIERKMSPPFVGALRQNFELYRKGETAHAE